MLRSTYAVIGSDANRSKYYHNYYTANKHRKTYTYVKKGVTKRLSPTQYDILVKMRTGFVLYQYYDNYRYFENGVYHMVNKRSVDCLITSKHLTLDGTIVRLTQKGIDHKQSVKKCLTN